MINVRKPITYLLIILLIVACRQKPESENRNFVLDIPDTSKTHQRNIFYEVKKNAVEELNLQKLEFGSETFELRLWTKMELTNQGEVIVIKKIKNQWTCLDYLYIEKNGEWENGQDFVSNFINFSIDTFWVNKKTPQSGWSKFLIDLEKSKILELPDQNDIKGWENKVNDGLTYCVEFATKNKYKFYAYNCPDVYEDKFIECKQMTKILEIFDKEIGLRVGWNGEFRCRRTEKPD